jgi:hypothetical protein
MEIPAAYTVIAFDPACFWEAEFAGAQPARLTASEIAQVEAVLAPAVAKVNYQTEQACAAYWAAYWAANPDSQFGREQALIDLPRYARQYVALTTSAGEKLVWVQLLRHPHAEWRTQLRWVLDGGNAYINATVSPAAGELRRLSINGVA